MASYMKNKINMITSTNWIINVCPHPEADVYEALIECWFPVYIYIYKTIKRTYVMLFIMWWFISYFFVFFV